MQSARASRYPAPNTTTAATTPAQTRIEDSDVVEYEKFSRIGDRRLWRCSPAP